MAPSGAMLLTSADGTRAELSSRVELERALATVGDDGNEYAAIRQRKQAYLQASWTGRGRFVLEYRDGPGEPYFASSRTDVSRAEVLELFGSYLDGTDAWRTAIAWESFDPTGPERPGLVGTGKRAPVRTRADAVATIVVLFGVVGCASITLGLWAAGKSRSFLARAQPGAGTVVAHTQADGRHTASFPIVEFRARDGRVRSFQGDVGITRTQYRIGDRVAVLYDPANPENARLDDESSLWYFPFGIMAFGVASVAVAVYALLRTAWATLRRAGSSPPRR